MQNEDRSLELQGDELRALANAALDRVVAHIASLPDQPSANVDGAAELARSLKEPLPERGTPYEELLDLIFQKVVPTSFNTAGPGYLAYIPGGGLPHSAVADLITDITNRYVGVWLAAPGLVQLESNVVRWFCDIVGYPPSAGGVLTTGGSVSNLMALVTARRELLGDDFSHGVAYTSDQTHHSVLKAALLAGVREENVREIPSDELYRIRVDVLAETIAKDRANGLAPFFVAGTAGTTNTGAVDDLAALADLAEKERLWFHVDGAYGGFFLLTEHGRKTMTGIERADSVALDPHKGLFLPYGNGALLTKDAAALKRAHSVHAHYLPQMRETPEFVDFCEVSPELSRDCRGLRVWLPFKMHGIGPFRTNLQEKLDLTRWATEELKKTPGIEILAEPQLSIVAFRLAGRSNEDNQRFLSLVNARKRVYITATMLGDAYALRICVLSFRTHMERMEMGMEDIRAAAREVLAS